MMRISAKIEAGARHTSHPSNSELKLRHNLSWGQTRQRDGAKSDRFELSRLRTLRRLTNK